MGTFIRGAGDLRLGTTIKGGASPSSLLTGLVNFWKMDEVSGTRADTVGGQNLTDNNTVASTTGLVYSLAGDYIYANSEFLLSASYAISPTAGFTTAFWAKLSNPGYNFILGTVAGYGVGQVHLCCKAATGSFFTTNTEAPPWALNAAVVPDNAWHLFIGWYDASATTNNLQIDNGTVTTGTAGADTPIASAVARRVGSFGGGTFFSTGQIGPGAIWSRVLTSTERTTYFNGGAGRPYPFT